MLERVKKTIRDNALLADGDSVLVGLSGGPDSVALLDLLSRLKKSMRLQLAAVYINHNIRPDAAVKEEAFCRGLCRSRRVKFALVTEDVPALSRRDGTGIEETARDVRYRVFDSLVSQNKYDKVALGHQADDRVETILFRILRGTGRSGLIGMPIRRDKIVRPLFEVTKADILQYLKKRRLNYCVDESNNANTYSRNYIRNRLLVDIREHLNPAVDTALLNLAETAAGEEQYLRQVVDKAVGKAVSFSAGGKLELDLQVYSHYDIWLRRRLLRYCLTEASGAGVAPDKKVVDRLDVLGMSGQGNVSLPGQVQAVTAEGKLVFYRRSEISFSGELRPEKDCEIEQPKLRFSCRETVYRGGKVARQRRVKQVTLDRNKLTLPLVVRNIRAGDRFVPLGMRGTKKIGDYLTDKKIHRVYRDEIPVVCDIKGIVWLVGVEIADRVKVDRTTRKVLTIEFTHRRKSAV